jgi:hypothetical protein
MPDLTLTPTPTLALTHLEPIMRAAVAADLDAVRAEAVRALRGSAADREAWGDPRTVARRAAAVVDAWTGDVDLPALGVDRALVAEAGTMYSDALRAEAEAEAETERLVREALEDAGREIAEGWPPATPVQEAYQFDLRELCIASLRAVRAASGGAWKATRADFVVIAEAYRAALIAARSA